MLAIFSVIERKSTKMDLAVNEGKTKYLLLTSRKVRRNDSQVMANKYAFDTVKEFIYHGSAVAIKINKEITQDHSC